MFRTAEEEEFVIYYVTICCHFLIHFVNRIAYKARVPCVLSLFGLICYSYARVLSQYRELESSSVAQGQICQAV